MIRGSCFPQPLLPTANVRSTTMPQGRKSPKADKQRDQKCRQRLFRPWQRGKGREEDSGTLELGAAETLRESFLSLPLRLEFFSPLVLHGSLKSHKSPRHQNRELRGVSRSRSLRRKFSFATACPFISASRSGSGRSPTFFAPRKSESGKLPPKYRLSSRTKKRVPSSSGAFQECRAFAPPPFFCSSSLLLRLLFRL